MDDMEYPYNLDYAKKLVINTNKKEWVPSSLPGVDRCMLERESAEAGITTSVVTYAPNSHFSAHTHPNGEEIFVVEGVFSDDNGDYEAGTYIRNPAGSSHSPFSKEGCKLFVKLNQFLPGDDQPIAINTNTQEWFPGHGELKVMSLSSFGTTGTALQAVSSMKSLVVAKPTQYMCNNWSGGIWPESEAVCFLICSSQPNKLNNGFSLPVFSHASKLT